MSIVTSMSAQSRGIILPDFCVMDASWKDGIMGEIGAAYNYLGIAKCKHKLLRSISPINVKKGKVVFENNTGKIQIIYGGVITGTSSQPRLYMHTYLFSMDKQGKYIDSIYLPHICCTAVDKLGERRQIIIYDKDEGNGLQTRYYLTPDLKFKKIN